ncbi:calcium/sodium antiporter [Halorubellus sp. JP-L1]|nr:calcium/sodium antiporter [Halorubellus sp. JP-L1]
MAALLPGVGLFVVSLAVLLKASDAFTSSMERIGLGLGISPFVVGATIVAAGTSLPELASSVLAVLAGEPGIVAGNVVGSNVANVFLVLGTVSVVGGGIVVDREVMRVDLPLLTASAVFLLIAAWDGAFAWYEGVLALVGLVAYVEFSVSNPGRLRGPVQSVLGDQLADFSGNAEVTVDPPPAEPADVSERVDVGVRTVVVAVASLAFVVVGANYLVEAILAIAAVAGVGTEFVAITAVAVGTSLPEIAVSVAAVRQGSVDIAVGNVLGSNVFNAFAVMGVSSFVGPLAVPPSIREFALPVMVIASVLYLFIAQDREITPYDGVALLLLYAIFLANLFSFT